jgi:hypothetical protein
VPRFTYPHDWSPMFASEAVKVMLDKMDQFTPPGIDPVMKIQLRQGAEAFAQMGAAALVEAGVLQPDPVG